MIKPCFILLAILFFTTEGYTQKEADYTEYLGKEIGVLPNMFFKLNFENIDHNYYRFPHSGLFLNKSYSTISFVTDKNNIIEEYNFIMKGKITKCFYDDLIMKFGKPVMIHSRDMSSIKEIRNQETKDLSLSVKLIKIDNYNENIYSLSFKRDKEAISVIFDLSQITVKITRTHKI